MQISANPIRTVVKTQFLRWRLRQVSKLYGVSGFGFIGAELDSLAWLAGEIRWKHLQCISMDGNDLDYRDGDSSLHPNELFLPDPEEGRVLSLWVWPYSQEMLLGRMWGHGFYVPFGTDSVLCAYRWIGKNGIWELDCDHFPPVVRLSANEHWRSAVKQLSELIPDSDLAKAFPWLLEAEPLEFWRECVRHCLSKGVPMEKLPRFHRHDHGEWVPRMIQWIKRTL